VLSWLACHGNAHGRYTSGWGCFWFRVDPLSPGGRCTTGKHTFRRAALLDGRSSSVARPAFEHEAGGARVLDQSGTVGRVYAEDDERRSGCAPSNAATFASPTPAGTDPDNQLGLKGCDGLNQGPFVSSSARSNKASSSCDALQMLRWTVARRTRHTSWAALSLQTQGLGDCREAQALSACSDWQVTETNSGRKGV